MGMVLVAARAALMAPGPTAMMTSGFVATSSTARAGKRSIDIVRGEDLNAEVTSFHEPKLRQFRKVQLTEVACAKLIGGQQADPPDLLRRLREEQE